MTNNEEIHNDSLGVTDSLPEHDDEQSSRFKFLHRVKRVGQAGIIAAEVLPINEAIRYGALAAMLQSGGTNPLLGAAVLGGATFVVEGAAALASSDLLSSDKSREIFTKINEKLKNQFPETFNKDRKMGPLTEAGVALLGGSAVVLAAKQREEPSRTTSENRRYGIFTASWLSVFTAVQGGLITWSAEGQASPLFNPRTIGTAVLTLAVAGAVGKWAYKRGETIVNPDVFRYYDRGTGEEYFFTTEPNLIEEANFVEGQAWLAKDLGDSSVNRKYDNQSSVLVASKNGEIVGTSRIFRHGEHELPSIDEMPYYDGETRNNLKKLAREGVLEEFGITARDLNKSTKHKTAKNMFRLAYREAKSRGVSSWLIIMEPPRVKQMNRIFGFTFHQLGPEIYYQGGDCAAHLLVFEEVEKKMSKWRPWAYRWFTKKSLVA